MPSILYSCIGTTDPVRGMKDGGLLHIMRFYRPDRVYLFLSAEIVRRDREDDRINKTFTFIRENWCGYNPTVIRFETNIEDPSDMDALLNPMNQLLDQVVNENPNNRILLNLSSGTPQMQIILSQMALDSRYPTLGIQVKNPERQSGTAERTNIRQYPVDEALGLNEDEEGNVVNRCCEPKMMAVRREAIRNQLHSLISQRNYAAIAQMGAELPAPIPKLAKHLDYRSRFLLADAENEAAGLSGMSLHSGKGVYPYPIYEMIEFFGMLKHLVYLKRYTDFMLRLNPFLVRFQSALLNQALKPYGLAERDLIQTWNGHRKIRPDWIVAKLPEMLAYMEKEFNGPLEERDVSIRALNSMLSWLGVDSTVLQLLTDCEIANADLRNMAAHDLFTITNEDIRRVCGTDGETLINGLEKVLTDILASYNDRTLKKRIHIYEHCDRIIRNCL